ncbi:MAG TPA: hypothetical protein VIY48_12425 [Candidatus Paceibacterota bacterium]
MRKIVTTGRLSVGLMMALAVEGMEIVQAGNVFTVQPQCDLGFRDDLGRIRNSRTAYGPEKKGKGGKVKRW